MTEVSRAAWRTDWKDEELTHKMRVIKKKKLYLVRMWKGQL